jgi:hypothetical protein
MSNDQAERPDGYYVVKVPGEPRTTIAVWGSLEGVEGKHWTIAGVERPLDDSDLLEIGRRIDVKP